MKSKFVYLTQIVVTVFSLTAHAGGTDVGNGEGGVSCPYGNNIELLDTYEARELYGRTEIWRAESVFLDDELALFQRTLESALWVKRSGFLDVLSNNLILLKSSIELVDGPLPWSQDYGFLPNIPPECHIVQIALRGEGVMSGRLLVNRKFWNSASARTRALLLIHEASHSWFNSGYQNLAGTLAVRQLVGLLNSVEFVDEKAKEIFQTLIDTRRAVSTEQIRL